MRKSLKGTWLLNSSFLERRKLNNLKVSVPGSIYSDLLRYKLIEEPYFRDNETKMLKIVEDDYAYSRSFKITKKDFSKEVNLVFLGIDTVSEIYVNEMLVNCTYNMHRRYVLNINSFIKVGNNNLKVIIKSPLKFMNKEHQKLAHELMNMEYAVKGYTEIRKAHAMFGWDWGPQMPDGGIWRDCFLEIVEKGKIEDVLVYQDTSLDKSKLKIKVNNHLLNKELDVVVDLSLGEYSYTVTEKAEKLNVIDIVVDNPKLWYPVGYGKHPLYDLKVTLIGKEYPNTGKVEDEFFQRIGLRKMEIVQEDDEYGRSFTVQVNGIKVFIKGSDYIIEDNILPRTNIKRSEYYINAALSCNHNCLRIWGGGIYPSDEFYNLCDEKGLLIWQDLMFACGYYNMENEFFVREITKEILDNVRRIHNHPCIMLICGNNENETAALDWNVPSVDYTKKWYLFQYEELIPYLVKKDAYDIFYWPSSPSSGGGFKEPNSDKYGDMHYWGVWHGNEPIENYSLYFPRMLSEFGLQSLPLMKTIKSFTLPSDRNIYSYVMERHQKNKSCNQKIMNYIGALFKYPKNLEYISYVSELIQAIAVKYCVEHLRRNMPRCMGAIYWQLNDCWPVISWSSIDYYGRFKALQYYSKKFYAKELVSIALENDTKIDYEVIEGSQRIKIYLTSENNKKITGKLKLVISTFDGRIIEEKESNYEVNEYSSQMVMTLDKSFNLEEQKNIYIRVIMYDEEGNELSDNDCSLLKDKHLNLKKPHISYKLDKDQDTYYLRLISDTYAKYVWVDLKNTDVIFSDNYFNLYPRIEKVITFKSDKEIKEKDIKIINLVDSY